MAVRIVGFSKPKIVSITPSSSLRINYSRSRLDCTTKSFEPNKFLFTKRIQVRFASTLEEQQKKAQEYLEKQGKSGKDALDTMQDMIYKDAKIGAVRKDGGTKRWYKNVAVVPLKAGTDSGWTILLDKRQIRTPKENIMIIPSKLLALSVAAEWDHLEFVRPVSMPMMTLVTTAIDLIPNHRKVVIDSLLSHLKSDTLCYRSASHAPLRAEQQRLFDPWLKWFSEEFIVPPPRTSDKLGVIGQPDELLLKIQWMLFELDDFTLAGLESLTTSTRSFVIAVAVWKGKISLEQVLQFARLEEAYGQEGVEPIPGYTDVDDITTKVKVTSAVLFMNSLTAAEFE